MNLQNIHSINMYQSNIFSLRNANKFVFWIDRYYFCFKQGPKKTKIQVYVNSLGLPPINQTHCYHYLEIRDYLSGAPGKLYVSF